MRLRYTDKHPRIGQILETIELLKVQQDLERSNAAASGTSNTPLGANPLDINPVYQNMRIQLSTMEVEIASLRAELSQQQKRVVELKTLVDTVPQVEVELGRLNRDYDVVQTKYAQLLAQLERARIGEDVEEHIDEVKFRIIDPPFAGLKPIGPRRHLLLAAVLIVALGLGGALMFFAQPATPGFLFQSRRHVDEWRTGSRRREFAVIVGGPARQEKRPSVFRNGVRITYCVVCSCLPVRRATVTFDPRHCDVGFVSE